MKGIALRRQIGHNGMRSVKAALLGLIWTALAGASASAAQGPEISLATSFNNALIAVNQGRKSLLKPRAVKVGYFNYDDNRTPVPDSSKNPYNMVGRLISGGKICTAFLISRQAALTAAHCVDKKERSFFEYQSNGLKKKVLAAQVVFLPGYQNPAGGAPDSREDMAILLFKNPLFPSGEGLSIASEVLIGQAAIAVGFPGRNGEEISPRCSIRNIAGGVIHSDCATSPGESGGPLLIGSGGKWRVAGIVSSELDPNDPRSGWNYSDETANRFCDIVPYKNWILSVMRRWENRKAQRLFLSEPSPSVTAANR